MTLFFSLNKINYICGVVTKLQSVSFGINSCLVLYSKKGGNYSVKLPRGDYQIELWGAQGGHGTYKASSIGGNGAYVYGILNLTSSQKFAFFLGEKGKDGNENTEATSFNGGGSRGTDNFDNNCPGGGGGGGTDMRIEDYRARYPYQLRIMVAGGGGGGGCYGEGGNGGHAGLNGKNGNNNGRNTAAGGQGGTQTSGNAILNGGKGSIGDEGGGGGGGGYFGGKGGAAGFFYRDINLASSAGGGGGSSYASGSASCVSYNYDGTRNYTNRHPSGLFFTNIKFIGGDQSMPNPFDAVGGSISGNGAARIIRLDFIDMCKTIRCPFNAYLRHILTTSLYLGLF
ncbi:PE-PGRS protein, putative [Trichomonas vaginalis G3]|uniref:receptor protein-tyrosine kinase n=1 Tax=Trichomonas vaginalis (strain ATCC PRA-98 / G3) TaxID=412133 RepID=A2EM15_TRIV3|nr:glycine-rich protein family [Trichomonas vaginalis G3]EAY06274.1 PE-PGRS protein, putative [Trichomonas vaginalis G3]KAI5503352.1 glycine-rich protein family [Trichomonas vaginalis G3]|eukprot:XP_001318497.1 PE-PGRS protein [Trichomonas vaginalis G3]